MLAATSQEMKISKCSKKTTILALFLFQTTIIKATNDNSNKKMISCLVCAVVVKPTEVFPSDKMMICQALTFQGYKRATQALTQLEL
jgi:hypothetical protein